MIGLVYFYTTELHATQRGTPFVSNTHGLPTRIYQVPRVVGWRMLQLPCRWLSRLNIVCVAFYSSYRLLLQFDILVSLLGTSLPFPVCISPAITTTWMTVLGYLPPALAFITVLVFVIR